MTQRDVIFVGGSGSGDEDTEKTTNEYHQLSLQVNLPSYSSCSSNCCLNHEGMLHSMQKIELLTHAICMNEKCVDQHSEIFDKLRLLETLLSSYFIF